MKKIGNLEFIELLNGLVFFSPVSLLVRTQAGISMSEFFILQAILSFVILACEIPTGLVTDRIGYKNSLVLSQSLLCISRALLLAAFLSKSLGLFVVEALVEGISSCFLSGTNSAYLYNICTEDEFLVRSARISNFGTAGFIISTICYVFIYHFGGIVSLIGATIVACFLAIPLTIGLPKEDAIQHNEGNAEKTIVFFKDKIIIVFILFAAAFSIGSLVINFFYVDKLMNIGIIDRYNKQDKRATILSVMNMGGNILEVIFLLASACIANIGISVCFIVSAVLIIILSAIVFLLSRSFYQDESENS